MVYKSCLNILTISSTDFLESMCITAVGERIKYVLAHASCEIASIYIGKLTDSLHDNAVSYKSTISQHGFHKREFYHASYENNIVIFLFFENASKRTDCFGVCGQGLNQNMFSSC